jgi:hypothetical protein
MQKVEGSNTFSRFSYFSPERSPAEGGSCPKVFGELFTLLVISGIES